MPDDLPHDFVLEISRPYLGKFISVPSDWTPLKNYSQCVRRLRAGCVSTRPIPGSLKTFW